ncbi:MAG: beta-galactosidase [Planctomycetes bacterium]|nr:beta-galactosidase [Planctomycetota bacterium]
MRHLILPAALVSIALATPAAAAGDAGDSLAVDPAEVHEIVARHTAIFTSPPAVAVSDKVVGGPILGNGDVGVAMSGPPERQNLHIGKNDFWSSTPPRIITVGGLTLEIPGLEGASYRQEQDLLKAEIRGTFVREGTTVRTRSWIADGRNLLVTHLEAEGVRALAVTLRCWAGPLGGAGGRARIRENDRSLSIGREQHGGGRWVFDGLIDEVRIYGRAIAAEEVAALKDLKDVDGGQVRRWDFDGGEGAPADAELVEGREGKALKLDGRKGFIDGGKLRVGNAIAIAAWVRPFSQAKDGEAHYIVSKGEWLSAYSLGLSAGHPRMAIGDAFAQGADPLPLDRWSHLAGTFDGARIRLYVDGKEVSGRRLAGGLPAAAGHDGDAIWFARSADAEKPDGRTVAVVTRIIGAPIRPEEEEEEGEAAATFDLMPGGAVTLVSAILSDLDAPAGLPAAREAVALETEASLEALREEHRAWWRAFWSRSFIDIPDDRIEQHWYGALYIMGSCSRPGEVAPGLFANWITTDKPAWQGDYTLNYNFEAPYWGLYSANHVDLAEPYYAQIRTLMPRGREMARERGWQGVHFPTHFGPGGVLTEGWQDWGQRSDAAYAAINFIMHFYSTYDREWLRKTGYPFLREVAAFWEDYLEREGGRYVTRNDSIHEGSGPDVNPILSLGLVRALFRAMIDASGELGGDLDRRAAWQSILDNLSAYPVQERGGKTVFRYSEKGMAWCDSNTLGIQHIWPAGGIGLDSDPKLLAIARDTLVSLSRWTDGNGFATFYTAAARLGHDPVEILKHLREQCDRHAFPNLYLFYAGGGIESCGGIISAPNEMLLQSHEGVLRFFPCWPEDQPARFGNLRAYGAFLVSAERKDGRVTGAVIRSEKGRPCTIENPWPGMAVRLVRNGRPAELLAGTRFAFRTAAGETIRLAPEGEGPHEKPIGRFEDGLGGWSFSNGPEFPGAAGGLDLAREAAFAGEGGARLRFDFTGGGAYVGTYYTFPEPVLLAGLRFRIRRPAPATVTVRVTDSTGQTVQKSCRFSHDDWQALEVRMGGWTGRWGGADDGRVHQPVSIVGILLEGRGIGGRTGHADIDDVFAVIGAPEVFEAQGPFETDYRVADLAKPLAPSTTLLGDPRAVRVLLSTDGAAGELRIRCASHFQSFEKIVALPATAGEHAVEVDVPPSGWRFFGGENDGRLHGPIRLTGLEVRGAATGHVRLKEVSARTRIAPSEAVAANLSVLMEGGTTHLFFHAKNLLGRELDLESSAQVCAWDGSPLLASDGRIALPAAGQEFAPIGALHLGDRAFCRAQAWIRPALSGHELPDAAVVPRTEASVSAARSLLPAGESRIDLESPWGVGLYLYRYPETDDGFAEMDRAAGLARDAGVKWSREEFQWHRIEPREGEFRWDFYDRMVETARRNGIAVYGLLAYWSGWAKAYTPEGIDAYARWAEAVVRRYRDRIHHWEVWNEPNIFFWQGPRDMYADLLREAYAAIRRADSDARILGLSTAGIDTAFIRRMIELEAPFDVLTIHPYRTELDEAGFLKELRDVRALAGDRPIWITEMGWPTQIGGTDEAEQARLLSRTYLLAVASGAVENVSWYDFRDDGDDPRYNEHRFGAVRRDLAPKPAYLALGAVCRTIGTKSLLGALSEGEGLFAYRFGAGHEHVLAVWSSDGPRVAAIEVEGARIVRNTVGEDERIASRDGTVLVALPPRSPVYVISSEPATACRTALILETGGVARPGKSLRVRCRAPVALSTPIEVRLLVAPTILEDAPESEPILSVGSAPGEGTFDLPIPADPPADRIPLEVRIGGWTGTMPIEFAVVPERIVF